MLRVLGPLEIDAARGAASIGGPVPRRVLCALLAQVGAVVPVDTLVEAAWGEDSPASAEASLRSHVTRLREALSATGSEAEIERRDGGYRLAVDLALVDAVRFETLVGGVADQEPTEQVRRLSEALALWRGPTAYADLEDTAYPAAQAARLVELRGSAGERLVAALLASGDPAAAATEAEGRLREDPYREGLWEHLVVSLYRQGRQGDALAACRRARRELGDGLGVDPGPRLRELEQQVLAQDPALDAPAPGRPRIPCPYKGLARYEAQDSALFVGREVLIEDVLSRLVDGRLVVLVGPSGAGKSSLVRAGLVPALSSGAIGGSGTWSVATVVPGATPLRALRDALATSPEVLVVDQAEEAFLAGDGALAQEVGDTLIEAMNKGTRIVLALRADFYGRLGDHAGLARRAGPATVLVAPPDDDALRRIVTEPAASVGLRVEPALADLVVAEVRGRPGALPVLSTALVRTWEHREGDVLTTASYRAGGGVSAALQRVGEEAWADLDDDDQRAAARRILLRLATFEDGAWVRRRVGRTEVVADDDSSAVAALQVLTDRRIVVARSDDVEIAHEAVLTGWPRLAGWLEVGRAGAEVRDRLAVAAGAWHDGGEEASELYRGTRLASATEVAASAPDDLSPLERRFVDASVVESKRDLTEQTERADREALGRRRVRAVAAGLAVALVAAGVLGGYAVRQQRAATASAADAQKAAAAADAQRLGVLAQNGSTLDRSLLLAAQAVSLDPSAQTESALFATLLGADAALGVARLEGEGSVAFSADGSQLLSETVGGVLTLWTSDGLARVSEHDLDPWDIGRLAQWLPDGNVLAIKEDQVAVVNPSTAEILALGPQMAWGLAVSPDGSTVVGLTRSNGNNYDSSATSWDIGSPAYSARSFDLGGDVVWLTACGRVACVLRADGHLLRIAFRDGRVVSDVTVSGQPVTDTFVASPDGTTAALAYEDGVVRLVDMTTGAVERELAGVTNDGFPLAFSADGSMLAGRDAGDVLVWQLDGDPRPERFVGHGARVASAAFSADGATLATTAVDRTLITWDVGGSRRVGSVLTRDLVGDTSTLWASGSQYVVGRSDGGLEFVDPGTGAVSGPRGSNPHLGGNGIWTARSGPGSDRMVVADESRTTIWSLSERRLVATVDLPALALPDDASTWVSPDGWLAATTRGEGQIVVIDMGTGAIVRRLPAVPGSSSEVGLATVQGWTSDGTGILVTRALPLEDPPADITVIDASDGAVRWTADLPSVANEAVADASGSAVAVGLESGSVLFLDASDGKALAAPASAALGYLANVAASPNGDWFSASGGPPQLTLWSRASLRQVGTPLPLDVGARDARARFDAEGRLVVVSGSTMRVFTIDPAAWLARACAVAGRQLTQDEWSEVLPTRAYEPACGSSK